MREISAITDAAGRILLTAVDSSDWAFDALKVGENQVSADYSAWAQIPGSFHHITAAVEGGVFGFVQLIALDAAGNIWRNNIDGYVNQSTNTLDPTQEGYTNYPEPGSGQRVLNRNHDHAHGPNQEPHGEGEHALTSFSHRLHGRMKRPCNVTEAVSRVPAGVMRGLRLCPRALVRGRP